MTVQINAKQLTHSLNNFDKIYFCLKNENRLTHEKRISLTQYPEGIVKEAKVNPKPSFWEKHKTKILIGTAIVVSTLAIGLLWSINQPTKGCVEGFYDDWNDTKCIDGEFISLAKRCYPDRSSFRKLIEKCASGAQIEGCFHGNYYRELTQECRANPLASLCDGKYDYQNFLKEVKEFKGFRPTGIN